DFLPLPNRQVNYDVAERISNELKRLGYQISGLQRTDARRRGSISEPVYLGSNYEGLVYHQLYTTRAATSGGHQIDDVPNEAIERSLEEVFSEYHAEPRELTVVMGVRATSEQPLRLRNMKVALRGFNLQDIERWRYRIVVIEQDSEPRLQAELAPYADRYIFAYNPGPFNRSWSFNIAAVHATNGHGVMLLTDADLLPSVDFLSRGLEALKAGVKAVRPYNEIIYLDIASTNRIIQDYLAEPRRSQDLTKYSGSIYTSSS